MRTLQVELPDKLVEELESLVASGWFSNDSEAVRHAIRELLRKHPTELLERFQRDDIAWALSQKGTGA